MAIVIKNYY